jgi:hypothetical protein
MRSPNSGYSSGYPVQPDAEDPSHPINRCPTDILQYIFEEVVLSHPSQFVTAIQLAHVCQKWRQIVLETPTLWSEIICNMDKPAERMNEFWNWMRSRVKSVPTVITLGKLGDYPVPLLQYCRLNQIPKIKRLFIHATHGSAMREIFKSSFKVPHGCVQELIVMNEPHDAEDWPIEMQRELDELLAQFQGLRFLTISSEAGIDMQCRETYPCLQSLVFNTVLGIYIPALASSFPNLEILEIYGFDPSSSANPLLFENLTRLLIIAVAEGCGEWLKYLSCPRILELVVDETISKDTVYEFIGAHSSLRIILYMGCKETVRLSQIAPQITRLMVQRISKSFYQINHNQTPSFPFLKFLFLDDTEEWMDKKTFENLVRAHFLPVSHPRSRLPPSIEPIRQLVLTVRTDKIVEDFKWSRSDLYQEAFHGTIEAAPSQHSMTWLE